MMQVRLGGVLGEGTQAWIPNEIGDSGEVPLLHNELLRFKGNFVARPAIDQDDGPFERGQFENPPGNGRRHPLGDLDIIGVSNLYDTTRQSLDASEITFEGCVANAGKKGHETAC